MELQDDITRWIGRLSAGEQDAAQVIWSAYFDQLLRIARQRLSAGTRRRADEEDIALSAMCSFYRGINEGRFPNIADRDELWRLLVTIVLRKVYHQHRADHTLKRGGGKERGESVFLDPQGDNDFRGIEQVLSAEPTPEVVTACEESCEQLLAALDDDVLRKIAQLKLEGFKNQEIAEQLGCTVRSVERKLNRIRECWSEQE